MEESEKSKIDWFDDELFKDESYDEENEEEDSEEENEEDEEDKLENFEEEGFNFRLRHFLANQSKDVSLENILEIPSKSLEEPLPKIEEENDETIDYLTGNKIEGMKYQSFEPESTLS